MSAKRATGRTAIGDRGAGVLAPFESVVERYGADVWRFSVSQVGRERADDVFQETMLAALCAYPSLRDPGAVRSWLLRIAARKALDAFRAAARAPVPVADPPESRWDGVASGRPLPDEELWARVRALSEKQRQAVALRFVVDLEYSEVAAAMQTSPEAARRNVFEGLRALRQPPLGGPADLTPGRPAPSVGAKPSRDWK